MSVNIGYHPQFLKDAKRLKKKYKSLTDDLRSFVDEIRKKPTMGADLGGGLRKSRMSIASKGKGKSGGARVITFNVQQQGDGNYDITLLTLYDKNEMDNVSDAFLRYLVEALT